MNNAQMQRRIDGQTAIAQKVLSVVPMQEWWSPKQIQRELHRVTGSGADINIVEGCLAALRDAGLVKEASRDRSYQRVPMKDEPAPTVHVSTLLETPTPPSLPLPAVERPFLEIVRDGLADPTDPLERLGRLAARLRDQAEINQKLADELDEAALAMQAKIDTLTADTAKLHQLTTLLRSIGA